MSTYNDSLIKEKLRQKNLILGERIFNKNHGEGIIIGFDHYNGRVVVLFDNPKRNSFPGYKSDNIIHSNHQAYSIGKHKFSFTANQIMKVSNPLNEVAKKIENKKDYIDNALKEFNLKLGQTVRLSTDPYRLMLNTDQPSASDAKYTINAIIVGVCAKTNNILIKTKDIKTLKGGWGRGELGHLIDEKYHPRFGERGFTITDPKAIMTAPSVGKFGLKIGDKIVLTQSGREATVVALEKVANENELIAVATYGDGKGLHSTFKIKKLSSIPTGPNQFVPVRSINDRATYHGTCEKQCEKLYGYKIGDTLESNLGTVKITGFTISGKVCYIDNEILFTVDPEALKVFSINEIRTPLGISKKTIKDEKPKLNLEKLRLGETPIKVGDILTYESLLDWTVSYFDKINDIATVSRIDSDYKKFEYSITSPIGILKINKIPIADYLSSVKPTEPIQEKEISSFNKEITAAGYRVAAKQAITLSKNALIALLLSRGADNEYIKSMATLLDTEFGRSLISMSLGVGMTYIANDDKPKLATFAKECRIQSMTTAGNAIMDSVMGSVMEMLKETSKEETKEIETENLQDFMLEQPIEVPTAHLHS
jgi:hypothetical protein